MLRLSIAFAFTALSSQVFAHAGHIAPTGGHTHYVAVGAAIIALAIGAGVWIKAKRARDV